MPKVQISSPKLRQPNGVFSHATAIEATGRFVFISGMTARRPDGTIAGIGDITEQTRQVCENVKAAVEAVTYLLEHREEREQMRLRAHTLAQEYSYDAIADGRAELYRSLLVRKQAQKSGE